MSRASTSIVDRARSERARARVVVLDLHRKSHLASSWLRIAEEINVNRSQLVHAVTESTRSTRRTVEDVVEQLFGTIITEVRSGRKVTVVGFGTFTPTRRAARTGRNPRTGAAVRIPASRGVRFATGSAFKSALTPKEGVSMAVKKAAAKKAPARKAPARKTAAKKTTAKKTAAKKTAAKKAVKKAPARKAPARKTAAKKTTARKTTAKKAPARKTAAKKTTARKTTAKKAPARKTAAKKTTARKTTAKKAPARKTAAKKAPARKTAARKTTARKTAARKR
jgi:DNA-binding protein HU-beta